MIRLRGHSREGELCVLLIAALGLAACGGGATDTPQDVGLCSQFAAVPETPSGPKMTFDFDSSDIPGVGPYLSKFAKLEIEGDAEVGDGVCEEASQLCQSCYSASGKFKLAGTIMGRGEEVYGAIAGSYKDTKQQACSNDTWVCTGPSCTETEVTSGGGKGWPMKEALSNYFPEVSNFGDAEVAGNVIVGATLTGGGSYGSGSGACCANGGTTYTIGGNGHLEGVLSGSATLANLAGLGEVSVGLTVKGCVMGGGSAIVNGERDAQGNCTGGNKYEPNGKAYKSICIDYPGVAPGAQSAVACIGYGWFKTCFTVPVCPIKYGDKAACIN